MGVCWFEAIGEAAEAIEATSIPGEGLLVEVGVVAGVVVLGEVLLRNTVAAPPALFPFDYRIFMLKRK